MLLQTLWAAETKMVLPEPGWGTACTGNWEARGKEVSDQKAGLTLWRRAGKVLDGSTALRELQQGRWWRALEPKSLVSHNDRQALVSTLRGVRGWNRLRQVQRSKQTGGQEAGPLPSHASAGCGSERRCFAATTRLKCSNAWETPSHLRARALWSNSGEDDDDNDGTTIPILLRFWECDSQFSSTHARKLQIPYWWTNLVDPCSLVFNWPLPETFANISRAITCMLSSPKE